MKISLNKIRYAGEHYETPDLVPDGVDALLQKIGAQLGAVDEVIPYGEKFEGVIIVKVVSCEKHPDADKLSICRIDDGKVVKDVERGSDGLVQIVCGAPNVRAGMLAAWLPPGATVPTTAGKEPFVLEARDFRGQKSNGMLASPKELGIGDSHEGILEVDVEAEPGTTFSKAYRAEGEAVIDIENKMFTHRPDCFGILGITREIAGIQQKPFKSPDWYAVNPEFPASEAAGLKLSVTNELPDLVSRFTAVILSGISIKPSPVWLQIVLNEVGVRPINNVVDYTNFWMLETGQPLHVYDYDKVKALSGGEAALVIRNPKPGEKIKLLNGKEIEPRPEAIVVATDKQAIGIGGVMGGSETEVDDNTKNIILECANFDMYSVRRTSMAHGLFTDAVTRFTKGQSPLQNLAVLAKVAGETQKLAGGQIDGPPIDDNHLPEPVIARSSIHPPIKVPAGFVNDRLGLKLQVDEMKSLLENVEFKVDLAGDELTVTAPFWRTDIELREDIVEEIGRLYGYDKLPLELPLRDLTPAPEDPMLQLKARIRRQLSRSGANEVLTYSFVHGGLIDKAGQDKSKAFQVANALSPDLQYYRLSLIPSLLEKVHANVKAGYDRFALFEMGKGHNKDAVDENGLPLEFDSLAVVYAAQKTKQPGAAYYEARKFLTSLSEELSEQLEFVPLHNHAIQADSPFELSRSAVIRIKGQDHGIGIVGEFIASVRRSLKLPDKTAGFELGLGAFMKTSDKAGRYTPLPRFPKVIQDITLQVASDLSYQELFNFIESEISKIQPANTLPRLSPVDIYQAADDPQHKNITLRLNIASYDRTLTDKEVNELLDNAAKAAETKLSAKRV
jgi:phenylalanyl-tRNA synthetase beta chain